MRARVAALPSGAWSVWVLTLGLAVTSVWLTLGPVRSIAPIEAPIRPTWWLFLAAFTAAEIFVVHFQFRRDAHSFSLSEIPLVLGLFFLDPIGLVTARVVGGFLALAVHRRQSLLKLGFNISHFALETAIAAILFHAIAGLGSALGPAGWGGAYAATLATDLVAALAISAAISLSERSWNFAGLQEVLAVGSAASFSNTAVGLMAATILWHDAQAAWLLLLAAGMLFIAYRGYGTLRLRQESLELLYESTQIGASDASAEEVAAGLLRHARSMFRAARAEVILLGQPEGTRLWLGEDGQVCSARSTLGEGDVIWDRVIVPETPLLARPPIDDPDVALLLSGRGLRDAMVAPLRGDGAVAGVMLVGDRMGDVSTFDEEDLRLLETLANHVSVTVNNAQLIERLRQQVSENQHQALHDSLTGLPNRSLLRRRLRKAVLAGGPVAVMIIDLDRFKEINDTLGHHTGDLVLQQVGRRLSAALGDTGMVARLSGDEFAIVLPTVVDRSEAEVVAERLLAALEDPFELENLSLDVGASIGIALSPEHSSDPDTLIQRADVAMYIAKEDKTGRETYSPERDRYSPARLAMVGELRRAIETGGLSLVFQPKADLASGRIVGVEALVRWEHEERGWVSPEEFIPLAEHTGLIRPLTNWVLQESLAGCRRWRRAGIDMSVAVNLSARVLRDVDLPTQIHDLLEAWDLPAEALVLEITESSIMADPQRAVSILTRLNDMGVALSIDDFGTGYSSLAYLKTLPVRELKMDRTFVMGMLTDEGDAVIVRSTVDLGRNLGLRVIAEGVEDAETVSALHALGCDLIQGYHLARPMPSADLVPWVRARGGRALMTRDGGTVHRLRPRSSAIG